MICTETDGQLYFSKIDMRKEAIAKIVLSRGLQQEPMPFLFDSPRLHRIAPPG